MQNLSTWFCLFVFFDGGGVTLIFIFALVTTIFDTGWSFALINKTSPWFFERKDNFSQLLLKYSLMFYYEEYCSL